MLAAAVAVLGLAPGRAWAIEGPEARVLALAAALVAVVAATRTTVPARWLRTAAGVAALVAAVALTGPLEAVTRTRAGPAPASTALAAYTPLFAAVPPVSPTTVAVSGFPLTYPFLGPDLANTLRVPHVITADGGFRGHADCAGYRTDLAEHEVATVAVLLGGPTPAPPELAWAVSDPSARVLASTARGVVVALDGPADPSTCPPADARLDAATLRRVLQRPTEQVRPAVRTRLGLAP